MAYSREIIEKAKELYVSYNYSYKKVAETLNIKRWMTIRDWCKKFEWDKLKERIDKKTIEITEDQLVEDLSKYRANYKVENVQLLDFAKELCVEIRDKLGDMFIKDEMLVLDPKFMRSFCKIMVLLTQTISVQDEILFGKTSIDLEGDLNINADEVIKAVIDHLDATGSEEHDLDIKPYLPQENRTT